MVCTARLKEEVINSMNRLPPLFQRMDENLIRTDRQIRAARGWERFLAQVTATHRQCWEALGNLEEELAQFRITYGVLLNWLQQIENNDPALDGQDQ